MDFLCAVLRGEEPEWPAASSEAFWARFLEQSAYHGVDTLVWHKLKDGNARERLPNRVRAQLTAGTARAVATELVRANDIRSLHRVLSQAGISALLMKGAALAYSHYPAPHMRSRVDTDIFIAPKDIRSIREVFSAAGYRLEGWTYKSHQFKALRDGFGGQTIKYDVHWRSSNRSLYARILSHDAAESESNPVAGLGDFRALSAKHALIQACLHRAASAYHDPDRLIWLYDIYLLVSGMSEDEFRGFADTAERFGIQDICLEAIGKTYRRFGGEVPNEVATFLNKPVSRDTSRSRFHDSQLALIIDDMRVLPDTHGRFALVKEYLFPPGDYLLQRYGKTGAYWVPILYTRYFFSGLFERMTLR